MRGTSETSSDRWRRPSDRAVRAAAAGAPPGAWAVGRAYEASQPPAVRTAGGAWFTPPELARRLAALAAPTRPPSVVLDPACGGGALLVAAAERWPGARLVGVDLDPGAVDAAGTALGLALAGTRTCDGDHYLVATSPRRDGGADPLVRCGDGLLEDLPTADVVLANPPFRSPLRRATGTDAERRQQLAARFGDAVMRYVDDAALFLLAIATRHLRPGGIAVVVVPESLLTARDAAIARERTTAAAAVEVVWRDDGTTFPQVPTCALRVERRDPTHTGARARRADPTGAADPTGTADPTGAADPTDAGRRWAAHLAGAAPIVRPAPGGRIGDLAGATADFRDAHYLLARHVVEAQAAPAGQADPGPDGTADAHRLVTVGLIDPAHLRWGEAEIRFAKRRWRHPVVRDVPADFLDRRLGPKVLLATQTRVLEAVVDEVGDLVPTTPVITVRTVRPWHVGATLTSPVATAVALRRHAGAARSRDALKLAAREVLDLPTPPPAGGADWDAAAAAYRAAHDARDADARRHLLLTCGRHMVRAHAATATAPDGTTVDGDALLRWWAARLPHRST